MTDQEFVELANNTHLGYIVTGNDSVDRVTAAGLKGLSRYLLDKTAVNAMPLAEGGKQPEMTQEIGVKAINIETDDLSLFPMIYWAVDPGQAMLSDDAIRKLNEYRQHGGMLFIDTRDKTTANQGKVMMGRVSARAKEIGLPFPGLMLAKPCDVDPNDVADLTKVSGECHVLARSFYMLRDFEGRFDNGFYERLQVYVEKADEFRHDGVTTLIVGGNEWAAAWAVNEDGSNMFDVEAGNGNPPAKQRDMAKWFGVNAVMVALTGNYKNDQVHAPALLKQMGAEP